MGQLDLKSTSRRDAHDYYPESLRDGVEVLEMKEGLTGMANPLKCLVELTGFEPATYALRTRRSPS